jgi:hypothetical protein
MSDIPHAARLAYETIKAAIEELEAPASKSRLQREAGGRSGQNVMMESIGQNGEGAPSIDDSF